MIVRIPPKGSLFAGRYRVESELGRGGMGIVLGVRDEKTSVSCALKLLASPHLRVDAARLMREARALMLISSAHVVRVFEVDEADGIPYLVLERLEGDDLAKLASAGEPVPSEVVARWALAICDALSQAHALGIVHRDIKLSNLFLARLPDGRTKLKLLDFGISKAAAGRGLGDAHGTLTGSHGALGSPQYISPQQLAKPKDADPQSDLWSLGVVMFRLLAARFPFEGPTAAAILGAVREGDRPSLAEVAPDVPAEMAAIVERCLPADPRAGWASANELADALRGFLKRSAADDSLDTDSVFVPNAIANAPPARSIDAPTVTDVELETIPQDRADARVTHEDDALTIATTTTKPRRPIRSRLALLAFGIVLPVAVVVVLRSPQASSVTSVTSVATEPTPPAVIAPPTPSEPTDPDAVRGAAPKTPASTNAPESHSATKARPRPATHRGPSRPEALPAREPEPTPVPAVPPSPPSGLRTNPYR